MKIWVDADSCPIRIREIISKASSRIGTHVSYVANQIIPFPESEYTEMLVTGSDEGAADRYIVEYAVPGDLVVTRDIPLASQLVEKGITVLNDRGTEYTSDNIRQRLAMRNFMHEMRERGADVPKDSAFGSKEVQAFARTFDRTLTRLMREQSSTG